MTTSRYWTPGPLLFAVLGLVAVFLAIAIDGLRPLPLPALVTGAVAYERPIKHYCTPAQIAHLDEHLKLPAPPEGWPGTPQAVSVSNVFAGDVMVGHGEYRICGRMHDARTRDARFRASVGTVLVPPKGDHTPIEIAWATPLKAHWVPTVHINRPTPVHDADTLRLMTRAGCMAVALVLAFSALMGFFGTRNRVFVLNMGICLLLLIWQAVFSGLSGYPVPWLPIQEGEWAWLVACSALGLAALLGGVLVQAEFGEHWPKWQTLGRWLIQLFVGVAVLTPWLPAAALQQAATILDGLFAMATAIVLILAWRTTRRGHPRAFSIIIALAPLALLMLADLAHCEFLLHYRIECTQLAITWCLTVMAWMLSHCYRQLRSQRDAMRRLADTDALTGLQNRRAGLARLERMMAKAHQEQVALSIGFVDIDWFKSINDRYGHVVGDQVLVTVANTLTTCVRHHRDVVRMGGEEFLILLPGVEIETAHSRMNTIRRRLGKASAALDIAGLNVSVSIGLANLAADDANIEALLSRADAAMYRAKHNGRDQVMVQTSPVSA